jgi:hypothetical protein
VHAHHVLVVYTGVEVKLRSLFISAPDGFRFKRVQWGRFTVNVFMSLFTWFYIYPLGPATLYVRTYAVSVSFCFVKYSALQGSPTISSGQLSALGGVCGCPREFRNVHNNLLISRCLFSLYELNLCPVPRSSKCSYCDQLSH